MISKELENPMTAFMQALSHLLEIKYDGEVLETLAIFSGIGLLASLLLALGGSDLGAAFF